MKENKIRKIIIAIVIIICVLGIIFAVVFNIDKIDNILNPIEVGEEVTNKENNIELENKFINSFDNSFWGNIGAVNKISKERNIIFTMNEINESKEGKYTQNVAIPIINIEHENVYKINNEISKIFFAKALTITEDTEEFIVYTVEYKGYINGDILSLVIKSTLKEGTSPQRLIIKTYNYKLTENRLVSLEELIGFKNENINNIQNKINDKIGKIIEEKEALRELNLSVYERNINDKMYNIENITEFFYGENSKLYMLFPYGNLTNTSELDMIII